MCSFSQHSELSISHSPNGNICSWMHSDISITFGIIPTYIQHSLILVFLVYSVSTPQFYGSSAIWAPHSAVIIFILVLFTIHVYLQFPDKKPKACSTSGLCFLRDAPLWTAHCAESVTVPYPLWTGLTPGYRPMYRKPGRKPLMQV